MSVASVDDDDVSAPVAELRRGRWKPTLATVPPRPLTRSERRASELIVYPENAERPKTRAGCAGAPRPCPFVSCRHHNYLEVNPETGAIKFNFPHLEPDEIPIPCSLDSADDGAITLEEIGRSLGVTRERARQIETIGLRNAGRDETLSRPVERETYAGPSTGKHSGCP